MTAKLVSTVTDKTSKRHYKENSNVIKKGKLEEKTSDIGTSADEN